jgi:hypothetical protein
MMSTEAEIDPPGLDLVVDAIAAVNAQFATGNPAVAAAHASGAKAITSQNKLMIWFLVPQLELVSHDVAIRLLEEIKAALEEDLAKRGWHGPAEEYMVVALASPAEHDVSGCLTAAEATRRELTPQSQGSVR